MKKIILPIVLLALVGFGLITSGLNDKERKMAVAKLTKTQDRFTSTLEGLSAEELNFNPRLNHGPLRSAWNTWPFRKVCLGECLLGH